MRNLSKYIIIFLAIILSNISLRGNYGVAFLNTTHKNIDTEHSFLCSSENVNSIYFLHSQNENLVNFENNLPLLHFKNFSKEFGNQSFAFELSILNKINRYFSFSKFIHPSLSVHVIIFPSHFFG